MADPQTADQGFLAGLLGKFGADPAAAYGGLLSDPATQRQFALRSLGAAAQAFGQGAMPVPYKGGIPFGATLGAAGGAASTAGDELIKARLEQAQSEQAVQNAAALHAKQLATTEILKNYQDPNSIYNRGGGTGSTGTGSTGTGTDGKPLTGPAKIIAGGGGSTVGGIGGPDNAEIRTNNFAGMRVPGAGPGGPNTNPAGWQTFATPADGVQAIGNQLDRYAAGKTTGQPLATLRQMVSTWAPPSENDTDALIKRASTVTGLDPDAPVDLSNPAVRAKVTEAFIRNEQGGNLHPKAVEGLSAVYGNAWSPHGGQAQTAAAPAPAAEPPMAPSAAPPGGLLKLPDPTSAAPPQLATPPATGAPGPAAAAASPTLGLLASQQGGGEVGSPLGAATPQIAGIPRGLLAQVAGPGAADPSLAPAAVTQQAGPPHTGAAGAAELAGLLAQPPASAAPPTATPYTNAPPVTGPGAPAPGPAPGPAPPAPSPALGGAAPPMPQPVTPSAIPGAPSAQDVRDANRAVILHGIAGIPLPPNINEIAKFPMVGPTAQATAAGTAAGQQPYQLQQAANKAMWDIYVAQQKPREPQREGSFTFNPQTNQYTLNRSMIEADGSTHQHISILDQNLKPLSDYDAGPTKASPGAVAAQTKGGEVTQTPIELSKDVLFPPGSAAANQWHDAQMRGEKLPSNVQIQPNGSVQVTATQPTGDQIAKNQEEFGKLRDAAFDARNGAFEMQELRKTLNGMGAQGPATPFYSSLSSWAISLGLTSNADVKKYLGFSPANEAAAEKMSQDLLGAVLKAQFPQRITNADITTWKDTVPRGTMLRDAYDMLMDRVLMPKFENTAGRYAAVAGLPNSGDPQLRTFNQTLETYDKAHPLTSYIHTYSYGAPDENGVPHRMRWVPSGPGRNQGDWVDDAKNPVKF